MIEDDEFPTTDQDIESLSSNPNGFVLYKKNIKKTTRVVFFFPSTQPSFILKPVRVCFMVILFVGFVPLLSLYHKFNRINKCFPFYLFGYFTYPSVSYYLCFVVVITHLLEYINIMDSPIVL